MQRVVCSIRSLSKYCVIQRKILQLALHSLGYNARRSSW